MGIVRVRAAVAGVEPLPAFSDANCCDDRIQYSSSDGSDWEASGAAVRTGHLRLEGDLVKERRRLPCRVGRSCGRLEERVACHIVCNAECMRIERGRRRSYVC